MKLALYINHLDQIGGAEIATQRLAECLADRGHDVTLLTTRRLGTLISGDASSISLDYAKRVRVIRLPVWQRSPATFRRLLAWESRLAVPQLLRGTQLLHLRGLLPETLALARLARRLGIRTLCVPMASGSCGDVARFPGHIDFTACDGFSALTEPLRQELIAAGAPPERIVVIPNGVDIERFQPPDVPSDPLNVVFVGQFRPEKCVDRLLDAWTIVQRESPQARLTLVGGGAALPDYQTRAAQRGLAASFVPNTNDVRPHLHASSIFVLPGISEGMSNALLEAMAAGLVPIVAATPANCAVITAGVNGLTYPADSSTALAAAILRLGGDAALRQRLGSCARQTVVERFDLERVVDQYVALYAQLLGESG